MRTTAWIGVVLAAWMAWSAVGAFPVAVMEGDGSAIAVTAHRWAVEGPSALADAYRYEMQSGTYVLLMMLKKAIGIDTLVAFSILSAVAAAAFILVSARWISHLVPLSFPACSLLMMLFQETWTSAFYPNSNILAAALVMLSFNLLRGAEDLRKLVLGGAVFGLACWMRFDAVVLAPAVPLVLPPANARRLLGRTSIVATTAAIVSLLTMAASGAGLAAIAASYQRHQVVAGSWGLMLRSGLSFLTLAAVFLMVLGLRRVVSPEGRRQAALVLIAVLPTLLLVRTSLTTPKYLLYLTPFLALLAAHGVVLLGQLSGQWRRVLAATAAVLLAVQYPLGIQLEYQSGYHPQPYPTLLRFAAIPVQRGPVKQLDVVFGAGATMSTHDSIRLSSGILFANWTWRHHKLQSAKAVDAIVECLRESSAETVGIWIQEPWEVRQMAEYALTRAGYRWAGKGGGAELVVWSKGDREVRILCGEPGLQSAANQGRRTPLLALVMWNNRLPLLQERFPGARRLTAEDAGHNVYVLTAPEEGVGSFFPCRP